MKSNGVPGLVRNDGGASCGNIPEQGDGYRRAIAMNPIVSWVSYADEGHICMNIEKNFKKDSNPYLY
jgi:hypothetical protein